MATRRSRRTPSSSSRRPEPGSIRPLQIDGTDWHPPPWRSDGNLRALQPEPAWRSVMLHIGGAAGVDMTDCKPFDTGSDVVFGGKEAVIKLTAPTWANELQNEWDMLVRVRSRFRYETPTPMHHGRIEGWPFLVMRRLKGTSLAEVWPTLEPVDRTEVATQVGGMMRSLHDVLSTPYRTTGNWRRWIHDLEQSAPQRHQGPEVPAHLIDEIPAFLAESPVPRRDQLVLIHTEIYDAHVLLRPSRYTGWRVTGLIDFADSRIGHPSYDLPALVELLFRGDTQHLRDCLLGYGLSDEDLNEDFCLDLLRWALRHRFGSLARWLAIAGDPAPRTLAELALRVCGGITHSDPAVPSPPQRPRART